MPAAEAVVKLFRDHGNRADRKRARLKYVVHDWGVEKFREVFARDYFQKPLVPPSRLPITGLDLHLGWHPQGDGKWFLGLTVENGRVKDEGSMRLRTGLRTIVSKHRCPRPHYAAAGRAVVRHGRAEPAGIDSLLNEHGIPRPENLCLVRKWAWPARRSRPAGWPSRNPSGRCRRSSIRLETRSRRPGPAGGADQRAHDRLPERLRPAVPERNRPRRPRAGTKYTLYVGGDSFGRRMNTELKDLVPKGEIVPLLRKVFTAFKAGRTGNESFGTYCDRVGIETLRGLVHA